MSTQPNKDYTMNEHETKARAAGWKTSDFGNYLMAPIAMEDLKGSVQVYRDGYAFIERCEGDWEYACEVSGLEGYPSQGY